MMSATVFERLEDLRLQRRFTRVLAELSTAPGSANRRIARRRERLLRTLRDYRDRGRFPRNEHTSGMSPVFVDGRGTHCAVAHLAATTGQRALVERIAATANLATIAALSGDKELGIWLEAHGLTVSEAGRIQPSYPGGRPDNGEGHFLCQQTPPAAVARVKVRVGSAAGSAKTEVERVYGAEIPRGNQFDARFAHLTEDETLLVSVNGDGTAIGTAWPVFRDTVSLPGTPDMTEAEAASLMLSPDCVKSLEALRHDHVRPKPASATSGCSRCASSPAPLDAGGASIILAAVFVTTRILRSDFRRRRS